MRPAAVTPAQIVAGTNLVRQMRARCKRFDLIVFVFAMLGLLVNCGPLWLWYMGYIDGLPKTPYAYAAVYAVYQIPICLTSLVTPLARDYAIHYVALAFRLIGTLVFIWTTGCAIYSDTEAHCLFRQVADIVRWTQVGGMLLSMTSLMAQSLLAYHCTQWPYA